jgi:hypothetical protein
MNSIEFTRKSVVSIIITSIKRQNQSRMLVERRVAIIIAKISQNCSNNQVIVTAMPSIKGTVISVEVFVAVARQRKRMLITYRYRRLATSAVVNNSTYSKKHVYSNVPASAVVCLLATANEQLCKKLSIQLYLQYTSSEMYFYLYTAPWVQCTVMLLGSSPIDKKQAYDAN